MRQARLQAGLSQEALTERAQLSWRTISDLDRGVKQTPRTNACSPHRRSQ
jgi:DNA-binding XRE family transcriptional regulator